MRIFLAVIAGFLITLSAAQADSQCGEAPRVTDDVLKADFKGKAQALSGLIGKVDLEARIEAAQTDVFSKYPNADKVRAQAYFAYVFCTTVLVDPTLSAEQKVKYSVMLLPDSPATALIKQEALKSTAAGAPERAELLATAVRDQISAVLLIEDGHPDLALGNLQQAERLLGDIKTENLAINRLQRGYIYKTYAQGFAASGDVAHEQQYLDLALRTFEEVKNDPNLDKKTTNEFAGAINGIGNIHHQRRQFRDAIADYQLAVSLAPNYAYAWHDMFLAYFGLAQNGEVEVAAMREALDKAKENAAGWPGLDAKTMRQLEAMLARFERSQAPNPKSKKR